MIDRKTAEQIAQDLINGPLFNPGPYRIVIVPDITMEKDYGWVFFYNTERFLSSGDILFSLSGNVPFLVEKATGAVHFLPHPNVEIALKDYEDSHME